MKDKTTGGYAFVETAGLISLAKQAGFLREDQKERLKIELHRRKSESHLTSKRVDSVLENLELKD